LLDARLDRVRGPEEKVARVGAGSNLQPASVAPAASIAVFASSAVEAW